MADYVRQGFTSVRGLNTRGSIAFRFVADTYGNESTLAVKPSEDGAYQYYLPQKSGTLPISGTFSVDLPAVAATTAIYSTVITVSGIRQEDALVVFPSNVSSNWASTGRILTSAAQSNGNITLTFVNQGAATNGTYANVFGYTSAR